MRSEAGMARPSAFRRVVLPEETRPATTMFLPARTQAARKSAACWLRKPRPTSSASELRFEAEAADRADHVAVRGDRRDRGGEPGAVGEARFDPRCDPVEAFAFDLLEQPFEEGAELAVVGEDEVGDALDPVAGVAEDPARPVDHPFLRVGVGEHPLGDRAEPDQVVAQLAPDRLELLARRRRRRRRARRPGSRGGPPRSALRRGCGRRCW